MGNASKSEAQAIQIEENESVENAIPQELQSVFKKVKAFNKSKGFTQADSKTIESVKRLAEVDKMKQWIFGDLEDSKQVTVKLLIVALESPSSILAPVVNFVASHQSYGHTHAALQISAKVIDWNDSALVVPRKLESTKSIAALDIGSACVFKLEKTEDFMVKVAQVCVKWNKTMKYSSYNSEKSKNCQGFVDDMLKELSIKPNWQPCIAKFLEGLREDAHKNGNPHYYNENNERIPFNNHKELDEYVVANKITSKHEMYELLKSFDRGYWLRYLKNSKNMAVAEECEPNTVCPFGTPTML